MKKNQVMKLNAQAKQICNEVVTYEKVLEEMERCIKDKDVQKIREGVQFFSMSAELINRLDKEGFTVLVVQPNDGYSTGEWIREPGYVIVRFRI